MAATVRLVSVADRIPIGTIVYAYLASLAPSNAVSPVGDPSATAVVQDDGSLTFTGLDLGRFYVAWALTGGEWVRIAFSAQPPPDRAIGSGNLFVDFVTDYQADPNGEEPAATLLEQAVQEISDAGGGKLMLGDDARFNIDEPITWTDIHNVEIVGGLGTVLDMSSITDFDVHDQVLNFLGIEGDDELLTSQADPGETVLDVGDASAFTVGEWLLLTADTLFGGAGGHMVAGVPTAGPGIGVATYIGEQAEIVGKTATTITLSSPIVGGPYTLADQARCRPIRHCTNLALRQLTFEGPGLGEGAYGVMFRHVQTVRVEDLDFAGFEHRNIDFVTCVDVRASNIAMDGGYGTVDAVGYGLSVESGCEDVVLEGVHGENFIHAIHIDSGTPSVGINRRVQVVDSDFKHCRGEAIDSHIGAEDLQIGGCTFEACWGMVGLRGPSAVLQKLTGRDITDVGIRLRNQSDEPTSYIVQGVRIDRAAIGISAESDEDHAIGGGSTINTLIIDGLEANDCTGSGLLVVSTDTWRWRNGLISDVQINRCGPNAFDIEQVEGFTLVAITVDGAQAGSDAYYGIRLEDVRYSSLIGGRAFASSVGVGRGIGVTGGSYDVTIVDPQAQGWVAGLKISNDSTNVKVFGGKLVGNTDPYEESTGAGHEFHGVGGVSAVAIAKDYVEFVEKPEPAALAGAVRLWVRDAGGTTQLCAKMPDGSVVVLAP